MKSKIVSSWLAFATELTEKKIYSMYNCCALLRSCCRCSSSQSSLLLLLLSSLPSSVCCCHGPSYCILFSCTQFNTHSLTHSWERKKNDSFCTVRFNLIKNCNLTIEILRVSNVHTAYYKIYIQIYAQSIHISIFYFSFILCLFVCLFSISLFFDLFQRNGNQCTIEKIWIGQENAKRNQHTHTKK